MAKAGPARLSTFKDMFFGDDNLGDGGVDAENEPGNQMAGDGFSLVAALY